MSSTTRTAVGPRLTSPREPVSWRSQAGEPTWPSEPGL